jgi:hypothetical protein
MAHEYSLRHHGAVTMAQSPIRVRCFWSPAYAGHTYLKTGLGHQCDHTKCCRSLSWTVTDIRGARPAARYRRVHRDLIAQCRRAELDAYAGRYRLKEELRVMSGSKDNMNWNAPSAPKAPPVNLAPSRPKLDRRASFKLQETNSA